MTAHCAAAIAVLATVAALTLLPSVMNTSLAKQRGTKRVSSADAKYISITFSHEQSRLSTRCGILL